MYIFSDADAKKGGEKGRRMTRDQKEIRKGS